MKTHKQFTLAVMTICIIAAFSSLSVVAQESNATLQETLTWIKAKTDLVAGAGGLLPVPDWSAGSHATSKNKSTQYFYEENWQMDTSNQCTLTWRNLNASKLNADAEARAVEKKRGLSSASIRVRKNTPLDISVSLASLDPEKIKITSIEKSGGIFFDNKTMWVVGLSTTDDAQRVTWNGVEGKVEISSLLLVFQDQHVAERITRAFQHGVKLCGGRKSGMVKEPF